MKPTVIFFHEKKLITSIFSGVMSSVDMNDYFETFMTEIPADARYHEVVDFTAVNKFEINYDDFLLFSQKAVEVFKSKRVAITEFIVSNNLQLGMARMFSGMSDEGGVEFIFTKKNWS
jgi:hypothetical protein